MSAKFYDPQAVAITAFGATIQGFAEDSMIKVENLSDGFLDVVGVDGEVARSKSSDKRVRVTIMLLQTSESNATLDEQHQLDLDSVNGAGVGTFRMEDTIGGTICQGDQAWIVKRPDAEMKKTAGPREWVIMIAEAERAEKGN